MSQDPNDILGLDQQAPTVRRTKVSKIDQERLLGKKGLSYIEKNYPKLPRVWNKNNKHITSKQLRYDQEYDNLSSTLQFYQLWCHTLFPKAKFKDCISLIRGVTNRSPQLRKHRKALIDTELSKLRSKMGFVDVPLDEDNETLPTAAAQNEQNEATEEYHVDDDFDFMRRENGLFVDPDEDIYKSPAPQPSPPAPRTSSPVPPQRPPAPTLSDDDFSDNDQFLSAADINPDPSEFQLQDDHDAELAAMNELGM
ncbi:chromosome segregation in meiosis- protein [Yamadazyma tenuis]|uniref:Chromosome segregation in meiosis protein n=1 Tax=Candida tenuis (strain ATCC 10573 / BCRC 21748 / CBS 615 / JCM 9827 / NBRC 10315 / NRRL Y-1498 / VKM Y-70) TaxID=590646 RepID=G3BFL3_CANTC|nr:Swi3-domain-containing protein [Yamadazyma tenuis ATCC 10573]EGV60044.1 Swi3-domain-containing protein [Yamadazyma tenuis ATCC 10573]WEJ94728.1 chromosome segregation in meiosis- protein [Yamadazyma tenuis]